MATFIIDWPALLLMGVIFGGLGPRARWWTSRAFYWGLATAGSFTLVAMLSYLVSPDWMWMYFLEPSDVTWAVPGMPVAYLVTFLMGYAAAVALRDLGPGAVRFAAAAMAAGQVAVIALTWERYHLVGTAREWADGMADELFSASPAGDAKAIGLLSPIFLIVLVVGLVIVWRSRRATAAGR